MQDNATPVRDLFFL